MMAQRSVLAARAEPQDAVRRLNRARNVLGGRDELGRPSHPSMFDNGVISFAHGEGIRRPHPSVIAAGVQALLDTEASSIENYLFLQRLVPLDEEITRSFVEAGIPERTARNICLDSGTTRLFTAFLHAIATPGDVFLAAPTYYHPLGAWCELSGARLACVPTQRRNDYKLTRQDLEWWYAEHVARGLSPRPRGLFLFSPTQTGGIYSRSELSGLADFIVQHDLVVLEDAIFAQTEFDERDLATPLASFAGLDDRVVTVSGGSKVYGLANIRIGWGCGPSDIIDRMNTYTTATLATVPQIAKVMALAALRAPRAYLAANRRECRERARLVLDLVIETNAALSGLLGDVAGPSLIVVEHEPKAGHSMLVSVNRLQGWTGRDGTAIRDSIDVTRHLLSAARVAVSPGLSSGFDGCEIRLCFGCVGLEQTYHESHHTEFMAALAETLRFAPGSLPRQRLDGLLRDLAAANAARDDADNAGFAAGRAMIRTAFADRIVPAIAALRPVDTRSRRSGAVRSATTIQEPGGQTPLSSENGRAGPCDAPGDSNGSSFPTLNQRGRTTAEPNEYSWKFIHFAATCGAPALDIGAAFGVATIPALAAQATVIANDIEPRHLAAISRRTPVADRERLTLVPGRFPDELTLPDASLGAILASNVLNFLTGEEILRGARLMHRWLKPDGKVFIISGTPYAGNVSRFVPVYEERKRDGVPWPGEITDIRRYSCHETMQELPAFLHLLDDDVLSAAFSGAGFVVEQVEMYERANLPDYLQYDGRENVGLIARKPSP